MPTDRIRSASEPPPSIGYKRPVGSNKTASLPDLHGKLTTSTSSCSVRFTEPEALSTPDTATIRRRVGTKQLSDYRAGLTPAFDLSHGNRKNTLQPAHPVTAGGQSGNPVISSPPAPEYPHILFGPRMSVMQPGRDDMPTRRFLPVRDTVGAAAISQTSAELREQLNKPRASVASTVSETATQVTRKPQHARKNAKQARNEQQTSTTDGAQPQPSIELILELKRLVAGATQEQVKAAGGDLTKLEGFSTSPHKTEMESNNLLLKAFKAEYLRQTKGGRNFPGGFADKLVSSLEDRINTLADVEPVRQAASTEKGQAAGKAKKTDKLTLEQIPGLQDMFLTRAINLLIKGELHCLDPLIGDEGCQIRTPFILDMHRLVQEQMPPNAARLVREYRAKTDAEQSEILARLRALEVSRKNQDPNYENYASGFVGADPCKKVAMAKSGEYEAMLADLTSSIKEQNPEYLEYLSLACSEGSIYWDDVHDQFDLTMLSDRQPMFPNNQLVRRKMAQSRLSRDYLVRSAARLARKEGATIDTAIKEIGSDKKGTMQTAPSFLMAQSKKEKISTMLLHALQMHSAAAVTRRERLELSPYWETTRLALTHALKEGYPLVVNLRRLVVSGEGNHRQYSGNMCRTLFYEPTGDGYKYLPNPSKEQQEQGALLFHGFSMLRKGDTNIPGATLPIAPWVFKENPQEFLDGFTQCDAANLMLLGDAGTHHPLNTGDVGSGAYAYGLPGSEARVYSFDHDPGGWKYIDTIHDLTLAELGQPVSTQKGKEYLTPEFNLTDKSKGLLFPDECPVRISGAGPEFNIKEEYQLMKQLCQAAGMKNTMYSKRNKDGTAERVAQSTMPFVSTHIYASTFARENDTSKQFAVPETRGAYEQLDDLRKKQVK